MINTIQNETLTNETYLLLVNKLNINICVCVCIYTSYFVNFVHIVKSIGQGQTSFFTIMHYEILMQLRAYKIQERYMYDMV